MTVWPPLWMAGWPARSTLVYKTLAMLPPWFWCLSAPTPSPFGGRAARSRGSHRQLFACSPTTTRWRKPNPLDPASAPCELGDGRTRQQGRRSASRCRAARRLIQPSMVAAAGRRQMCDLECFQRQVKPRGRRRSPPPRAVKFQASGTLNAVPRSAGRPDSPPAYGAPVRTGRYRSSDSSPQMPILGSPRCCIGSFPRGQLVGRLDAARSPGFATGIDSRPPRRRLSTARAVGRSEQRPGGSDVQAARKCCAPCGSTTRR